LDLEVTGPCTVGAGTYHYRKVNIYNDGELKFNDADNKIDFWAYGIIIENNGSLIAGSPTEPITSYINMDNPPKNEPKLTIHLYGEDQGINGSGIRCKTDDRCGVPEDIWTFDPTGKVCLPASEEPSATCTT